MQSGVTAPTPGCETPQDPFPGDIDVQTLRDTAHHFRRMVAELPAAVYSTDANGVITFFNEAAANLWGRRPEIGRDLWCGSWRIYDASGTPMPVEQCPMAVTLREGRAVRGVEIIIERPDGSRRHVLPHPTPLRNSSGAMVGAMNLLMDIGDRVVAEHANRRLAAIVENSDDAIVSKNLDGVIMSWNRGAERLFGYTEQEVLGKPVTIFIPPDRIGEEKVILERIRQGIPTDHYETIRRRKDGTLVTISLTVSPIKDAGGRVVGASKIARDISEQKRVQRELERARDEAQAASHAKDRFFATLSHELRTPLNPVLLIASDAVEDPALPEAIRADFEMILSNVRLEARLIDDMLDLAKIGHGKLDLVKTPVVLDAIVRAASRTIASDVLEKKIELDLHLAAGTAGMTGDSVRLQQVFWNVLRNAVKFTPEAGRIMVTTRIDARRQCFVAEITDTGIGMTKEELGRVFEPFAQGDHAANGAKRSFGGLGLGLAISRQLVQLHAGRITVQSSGPGTGTTFTIELPVANVPDVVAREESKPGGHTLAPARQQTESETASQSGSAVLLVDDHRPTCLALSRFLARQGYRVLVANSISEARAMAADNKIDVLISDIGLPDGSGYDLMAQLRESSPGTRGIAVSGYGMPDDVERSRRAGFVEHCTKPVNVAVLHQTLVRIGVAAAPTA